MKRLQTIAHNHRGQNSNRFEHEEWDVQKADSLDTAMQRTKYMSRIIQGNECVQSRLGTSRETKQINQERI